MGFIHALEPVRHAGSWTSRGGCGGIGRRAALRSLWANNPWKFESSQPHHFLVLQLNYSIDLQAIYLQQSTWVDNMVDKSDASYLYQKRGVYYFSKQVPCDVKQHYSRNRIVICLRTKSLSKAMRSCKSIL